jgi:hypothetical protein
MKFPVVLGLTMGAAAAVAACSSSSGSPGSGESPDASTNSNDSSVSGDVAASSDGGAAVVPPIQCGSLTCNAPTGGVVPLVPCCLPNGKCGGTFGAAAAASFDASAFADSGFDASAFGDAGFDAGSLCFDTSPATADPSCPSESAMGFALTGCCTSGGVCGVDLSVAGLGCNSLSGLGAFAPAGDGAATVPVACGAADGGASEGGTPDGGAPSDGGAG